MEDFIERLAGSMSQEFSTFLRASPDEWRKAATGIAERMEIEELRVNVGNGKGDEIRRFRAFVFKGEEF